MAEDPGKLSVVPIYQNNAWAPNAKDVANALRSFADEIEGGEWGKEVTLTMVIDGDGTIRRLSFGKDIDHCHILGMLAYGMSLITDKDKAR